MNVDKKSVVFYHLTNKYTVCYSIPHLVRVPLKLRVTNEGSPQQIENFVPKNLKIESHNMTTTQYTQYTTTTTTTTTVQLQLQLQT